jgi:hypothetical protein
MPIFLSVFVLVYGLMHFYAFRKVWKAFPHSRALGISLGVAGGVLTLSPMLVRLLEGQDWHRAASVVAWIGYSWMGFLLLFLFVGVVVDFFRGLARLFNFRLLNTAIAFRVISITALALLGYGFYEAQDIRVERITITTPKLKSGRITIAQVSDLHLGPIVGAKYLSRVMATLTELKPDIVLATGDIVDGQGDDLNSLSRHFHAYTPPLGAYAVTGNHEYIVGVEHSLRFLRAAGFTVLREQSAKAGGIVLAGVDDSSRMSTGQEARADTRKALAGVTKEDFVVLLKHKPIIDSGVHFDLQLSGHTHRGQIFPLSYPAQWINGFPTGLTRLDQERLLYVSRGVGTWGPPIRVFTAPEITLFTIESSNP